MSGPHEEGPPIPFGTRAWQPQAGDRVIDVGRAGRSGSICGFCAKETATMYFCVKEFEIVHPQLTSVGVLSGDRFYACGPCGELFDAGDIAGLKRRYALVQGHAPDSAAIALLVGARTHREGPPVVVAPGTDPEEGHR
ncbi:hypothetical protein OG320_30885 [Microbispora sp. NBC_01189]|uniref:hypothetical protein n=1 Tax=unclassified Microbispora TaxID=2614687 RepID=UPI002E1068CB|nr:hypothetical protein OG320_30885 [Microbispora sp. NBC_01189]